MRCRLLAHHRSPPRLTAHHRASPHQRAPSCTMQAKEDGAGSATATPQDDKTDKRPHETWLYMDVADSLMPIIYTSNYNITFMGLEKMHPFDAGKWGKVVQFLKEAKMITDDMLVKPREAEEKDLLVAHTQRYLNSLKWSITVARITEVPFVAALPNVLVRQKVLKPFLLQTGGTVLAGKLAMERGWAVNVGGGFHHCSGDSGGGFCAYADITLCIKFLFERVDAVSKAMIVDLDAHQGNGHERDFMGDSRVYIMDVYNRYIYPQDTVAKRGIRCGVELDYGTQDAEYLQKVRVALERSLREFAPDIIVYNAGTDVLEGDRLGALSITPQGIIERDQLIFTAARIRGIPIVMVTSGGYMKQTARIIADSILNLQENKLLG